MVREMTPADLPRAVEVLVHAFAHDPALRHLLPHDAHRARVGPVLARSWLRYGMRNGRVWVTSGVEGVAVRRPPGAERIDPWGAIASGMWVLPFVLGLAATVRLIAASRASDARHHAVMPGPHWYCWLLAVHPAHQGEGHGGRLVAHTFAQADADGLPCYLETSSPRALDVHLHHGWEVVAAPEAGADLPVWSMVRAPRRRAA